MKETKTFNGVIYDLHSTTAFWNTAENEKSRLRRKGYSVRTSREQQKYPDGVRKGFRVWKRKMTTKEFIIELSNYDHQKAWTQAQTKAGKDYTVKEVKSIGFKVSSGKKFSEGKHRFQVKARSK